nr:Hpt domain-containing protein [Alteromonas profundi]
MHEGDEFVKEILDSVNIFDNELERATHSLKTMSKLIGAIRIVSICELLEQKLRAGDDDVLNQALAYEWEVLKKLLENENFIFKHK